MNSGVVDVRGIQQRSDAADYVDAVGQYLISGILMFNGNMWLSFPVISVGSYGVILAWRMMASGIGSVRFSGIGFGSHIDRGIFSCGVMDIK